MAVVAMWKCDRDGSMFDDKKDADAHDKMLELAEGFAALLARHSDSINEQEAEQLGLLLSKHKDQIIAACKGKPDVLSHIGTDQPEEPSNITPLTATS